MRTLVRGLVAEPAQPRGNDGRAGFGGRPFERAPLGYQARTVVRKGVSQTQAPSWQELADGRECVTNTGESLWCCTEDGSRPPEAGLQEQASNRPVLLRSKGVVVSDRGKVIHKDGRYVLRR